MAVVKFNDPDTELYLLAACLKGPSLWKNVPEAWFSDAFNLETYRAYKSFLAPPYTTYPTVDLVVEKVADLEIKLLTKELSKVKVDLPTLNTKLYDLYEMFAARKVYEVVERTPGDMEKMRMEEVIRSRITEFSQLVNPFEAGRRDRGFIYEGATARWQRYREIEANPDSRDVIPTHVSQLDRHLNGGLRPSHILTFFARSGGYKTLTKSNIAYNLAVMERRDTMVVTLEVSKPDYELIVDSRHAMVKFDDITAGNLTEFRTNYKNGLIGIHESKPPLYIVDIPDKATSTDLISEQELYYAMHGKYSDAMILDYVNEMEPVSTWGNTGEKFKNLGVELRRVTRAYKFALVASMQENRKGAELVDRSKAGTEHMGESHSFQNVCHVVVHLYQDNDGIDKAANQLHWSIKKNRYGPLESFTTFVNPEYKYVGDRRFVHS